TCRYKGDGHRTQGLSPNNELTVARRLQHGSDGSGRRRAKKGVAEVSDCSVTWGRPKPKAANRLNVSEYLHFGTEKDAQTADDRQHSLVCRGPGWGRPGDLSQRAGG